MTLHVKNLSCIRQDRLIFRELDFSLSPGSVMWIKGKNGAGKSSLLRMIAGLLRPVEGDIFWNDQNVHADPDSFAGQFHFLGHQEPLKPVFTVYENLDFWSRFHGGSRAAVDAAMDAFDLQRLRNTPARILSAGQKKRTNLARLIASPAPLWLLDEPLSSLDVHYIELFTHVLEAHVSAGGMALLATHQEIGIPSLRTLNLDAAKGGVS
ncbi:heme ABC exporter ATP-binding protein CcmA [Sneathiella aquimaris]|uniref:heme ABC exporter ATP-binding protein CcmA n=1 Tax=Sneathiella aquimaris TaxID=2599305 RepID=UPI00146A6660|nr:heme ABC exporter ATP-binding protein CcmA [Sneathiella aquimaris]